MTTREQNLLRCAEKCRRANEYAHDQTRQRRFERSFLSFDCPDENGDAYDYGDCGRSVRRMMRKLDAPYRAKVRNLRFAAALDALDGHPELQRTLRMMRRHRWCGREKIAAALRISPEAYAKRFTRLCRVLGVVP